jgi:hypothetical protein
LTVVTWLLLKEAYKRVDAWRRGGNDGGGDDSRYASLSERNKARQKAQLERDGLFQLEDHISGGAVREEKWVRDALLVDDDGDMAHEFLGPFTVGEEDSSTSKVASTRKRKGKKRGDGEQTPTKAGGSDNNATDDDVAVGTRSSARLRKKGAKKKGKK